MIPPTVSPILGCELNFELASVSANVSQVTEGPALIPNEKFWEFARWADIDKRDMRMRRVKELLKWVKFSASKFDRHC